MPKRKKSNGGSAVKNLGVKNNVLFGELRQQIEFAGIRQKDKKAILEMLPVYRKLGMDDKDIRHWVQINIAAVTATLPEFKLINEKIK